MRLIHCALLVALAGMPVTVMAADAPSNEEISKRLKALDDRLDRLERRERAETRSERKAAARKSEGKSAAARKAPTSADWAKVHIGMSEEDARKVLGEPLRTRTTSEHQIMSWHETSVPGGEIWFKDRQAERVLPPKLKP
jgi:hypothetical protein